MVWNDSCSPTTANSFCARQNVFSLASGSGGISAVNPLPSYQTLNIQGLSGANFPARVIPDVSLSAANEHDPYIFCFTAQNAQQDCQVNGGQLTVASLAGGTSFSSPEFAGIMALVDQATAGRQGLANFVLYSLAQTESAGGFGACNSSSRTSPAVPASNACVFNDITAGNNGVPGNDTLSAFVPPGDTAGQLGYNATAGFDPAIGLGSVNVTTLVNAWHSALFQGSVTTFTVNGSLTNAVTITHGQSVTVNATVTKSGTTTATPKGEVSLIASGGNLPAPGKAGIGFAAISGSGGTATTGNVNNVNNLPGGTGYSLMAQFPGDGVFAGSTSNSITVTVSPENSSTTLNPLIFNLLAGTLASGTTVAYGDPVNILVIDAHTLGVSQPPQVPALGSVNFNITGNPAVPLAIDNSGIAELADCFAPLSACLAPGTYTVSGNYSGDNLSYNPSSSAPVTITVTKGNPAPTLQAPATIGAGVAFTLTVTIQTGLGTIVPTGTVQFMDGTTALGGPVTLSSAQASIPVTLNAGGNHSLTAQYSGDATYNAAASAPLVVTAVSPFNLAATVASQTIAAGQSATFNVTLNGVSGFSGTVNFNCTGAPNGSTCAVSPASANLSSTTSSVPLTVTISNTANARMERPFRSLPFVFAGLLGVVVLGLKRNPRNRLLMLTTLLIVLVAGVSSCGGSKTPAPPTNATLTVTGTSGNVSSAVTLNLTVTH
jgi:trimeric autotransporter adhesin